MIYVAWADGDLTGDELAAISRHVLDKPWLSEPEREALAAWLRPESPPRPAQLQALLAEIRGRARHLPSDRRRTLVELGLELSQRAGESGPAREAVVAALERIEDALGMVAEEAAAGLLDGAPAAAAGDDSRGASVPAPPEERTPPAFDVARLSALLAGEQAETRRAVLRTLSRPEFAPVAEETTAEARERVLRLARELAAAGFGAIGYPREHGGGGDLGKFVAAFETLAFGDLSLLVKFGVQFGLFGGSVRMLGTEKHHARYLGPIGRLELPGCFAMSESAHGSNVAALETQAVYDPDTREFVVHTPHPEARKDWIGNAACHARMATVFVQLWVGGVAHGVHALLVPIRDERGEPCRGVTLEDCGRKMGLHGVDNGRISFDRVRVPRENLLDRFASVSESGEYDSPIASPSKRFFTMLGALVAGRVCVGAAGVSVAKSALTIAVRYGERRRQFGPPGGEEQRLMDYRTHQRRLLPRVATTYALDFGVKHLVERYLADAEDERRKVEALAAGLKAYATRHALDTLRDARECCGGKGYLAENRFAALRADADVFVTFEGDNTVLLQLVAKSRLTHYRQQFEELTPYKMLKFLGSWTGDAVATMNPLSSRATDRAHLTDRDFRLAAFLYRENHLLTGVARRLKSRIDSGMDAFAAFNDCQLHLIAVAEAYVERVLLERFHEVLDTVTDPDLLAVLMPLCDLFALSRIEAHGAWYLSSGYVAPPKHKAIRALVTRLCEEMREQAVPLVDAFGIPDAVLRAPIATNGEVG